MRLLITRPEEDALPLKAKLEARGHTAIVMPVLAITPSAAFIEHRPYQAICVTSANALRSITIKDWMQQLPVLTVGPQSLAEAQALGFSKASAHGGNVHELARHIIHSFKTDKGPLLYLAGDQVSADLRGQLQAAGFTVDKIIVYTAEPIEPPDFAASLRHADAVLLYSPRTAKILAHLVSAAGLQRAAARLKFFCLSQNVAMNLPAQWDCHISSEANEAGMLALLDRQA